LLEEGWLLIGRLDGFHGHRTPLCTEPSSTNGTVLLAIERFWRPWLDGVIGPTESEAADRRRWPIGRAAIDTSASLSLAYQQVWETGTERPGDDRNSPCHAQSPLKRGK
jgi:hypothetical protein